MNQVDYKKGIKYLIQAFVVYITIRSLAKNVRNKEALAIAMMAAVSYALTEMMYPNLTSQEQ